MNNCCICEKKIELWDKGTLIKVGSGISANKYYVCNSCCELIKRAETDLSALHELNVSLDRISPFASKAVSNYFHIKDESKLIRNEIIQKSRNAIGEDEKAQIDQVMLTTTDTFTTHTIVRYIEPISGEVVLGKGFESEWYSSSSNTLGGENGVFEAKMKQARTESLAKLKKECYFLGGNAVVGIAFDIAMLNDNLVSVMATGTAVEVELQ